MTAIRLVLSEVEGTLLTTSGGLTGGVRQAVRRLRDRQIEVAITSGRPPRGLRALIGALQITTPVGGFGGGMLVRPDLSVLEQHVLGDGVARAVIETMERQGLDVWVYQGDAWLVRHPEAVSVADEAARLAFAPEPVDRWDDRLHAAVKIAGLSESVDALGRCEADLEGLQPYAAVVRSPSCALAVMHPRANTGELVRTLSSRLGISPAAIAAIGHAPRDALMFRECGLAIAMGQAGAAVQRGARFITRSNDDEGFAYAVETWILSMV
jgi:Cof subfamily protein (haloacid dehalogenase superfamily)